jgi:diphosphate-dependent phosphofructokinase
MQEKFLVMLFFFLLSIFYSIFFFLPSCTAEDIERRKLTLTDVVREVADLVAQRAAAGKNFGVVLVPEGIIAAIPELCTLIDEISRLLNAGIAADAIPALLTPWSAAVLSYLPPVVRNQLFLERESSGAIQLSQISSETLLAELVASDLAARAKAGTFKGKFATVNTSFGYQARSSMPTNFDCSLGDALGRTAAILVANSFNGYMAVVSNLASPVSHWIPSGVPLTAMMRVPIHATTPSSAAFSADDAAASAEAEHVSSVTGPRPVIPSAHLDVRGHAFLEYVRRSANWRLCEAYINRGPIQFTGVGADEGTITLRLQRSSGYLTRVRSLQAALDGVRDACRPGVSEDVLSAAESAIKGLRAVISLVRDNSSSIVH